MSNTVTHRFMVCSGQNEASGGKISQAKADKLVQYLSEVRASQRRQGSVIVFCNRVDTVDAIVGVVNSAGERASQRIGVRHFSPSVPSHFPDLALPSAPS